MLSRIIDQTRWRKAYLKELERVSRDLPDRVLSSIFFGGGTPSLMDPDTVGAIIDAAYKFWPAANDVEVNLEANPSSVEAGRFRGYQAAGVNRVSLGIQALNDVDLRRLGRLHTAYEARKALEIARECFERVSFDLIYARQDQSLADWRDELTSALSLGMDHLSLYQLTIEDGTAFGDRYKRGTLRGLPEDDLSADMYELTQDLTSAAGLHRYEVSNYARDGAESRHNLVYWRYGDYAGIGPGAHGRVTLPEGRFATETALAPGLWLKSAEAGSGETKRTKLDQNEQAGEYLMMGLRIAEGIDLNRFNSLSLARMDEARLDHLLELGLLNRSENRISATDRGFALLNQIVADLLP